MTKKRISLLGLAPLTQSGQGALIYGAAGGNGNPSSKAELRIVQETQQHIYLMQGQRRKAEHAAHEVGQIHQQSAQEFLDVAAHMAALKEAAKGKEYQAVVEEFNQRSVQLAAQHLFGVVEVSARNIGMDTARPLYREEEPIVVKVEKKQNFLQRLIGG